ncbi:MAG: DEAD/DEAH box helicase [Planctomycetaceae bacterium]
MSVSAKNAVQQFHDCTSTWFLEVFDKPTRVQDTAWPVLASGGSGLLLAPTGSGKTLAAFLASIDRLMFGAEPAKKKVRVLYISPLKALGVDVDRNLRAPIAGLRAVAQREGIEHRVPTVGVRSGDTSQEQRRIMARNPPEILITTPESLYLLLTSRASETLDEIETVIIDEIHALAGTKRGTHLFLSLERLERLRRVGPVVPTKDGDPNLDPELRSVKPLQRVGLSATQRPLEEIARLLGGYEATADPDKAPVPRPVEIIDASEPKQFDLRIETPADELAEETEDDDIPSGSASSAPRTPSVWPSIHPRLVELIRANRSTMVFVNSRRLAERLATAINELAEEEIAQAHHGSIAHDTRAIIEDRLKRGELPAMIATSSMELGIDMGAVDLVIQIEAPPSIASGTQRIGRAGHQVGAPSAGVIFPKYRGDLLACAAATGAMVQGWVEETRYPRNPLDILAQQIVAMTSRSAMSVDDVFTVCRSSAPFAELPRGSFEGVLDLLAGRYPSDEFAELKPRINWDRIAGSIAPRKGGQRLAIANAGTIPDRGLYGVFLAGDGPDGTGGSRVGELDEEMVFETRPGDVFLLGASSWRVLEITRDRVLVAPAPGEPGRMPFWRGDGPGRPIEFGKAIGKLTRELLAASNKNAMKRLQSQHGLTETASESLLEYLTKQAEATGDPPSDKTIIVESFLDEIGDWRIVILTPFGSRVHAPWATIVGSRLQDETSGEVDLMWTDDGIVFRLPESDQIPPVESFFPDPDEVERLIVQQIGATAMFAGRFRENAARALLLPRRYPGRRTPLWLQRRRAADLLNVASKFRNFPILLETYRECLSDVFDITGLISLLRDVQKRTIVVRSVQSERASPFASAVMFNYAANFLYDGDSPLAERKAQALALDHAQLRELLGSADFRELFDVEAIESVERDLQRLEWKLKHADDVHDVLLKLGGLTEQELSIRCDDPALPQWLADLKTSRRVVELKVAGEQRYVAAEDAGRLRDGLGIVPPMGLPEAFLESVADPLGDLVSRFARTHGPFTTQQVADRFGLGTAPVLTALHALAGRDRVIEGEFRPGHQGHEWCDTHVLKLLKRRSLAALRKQVEPVEPEVLAKFIPDWHCITRPRRGLDGLLDAIEQLQGSPLPASTLESEILPSRVAKYRRGDLDELFFAGEVVWRGFDSTGGTDGRIALYLTDHYPLLAPSGEPTEDELSGRVRDLLAEQGALLFAQIRQATREFPNDVLDAIWRLVWSGEVTNDTLAPLRSLRSRSTSQSRSGRRTSRSTRRAFRSRRAEQLVGSEGRWSLLATDFPSVTERQTAISAQLVERYGVLTREMLSREQVVGGFSGLYPVLKAMEETGKVRRGYFVAGLGAAQFAAPGAEDRLRAERGQQDDKEVQPLILASTDPANAWGNVLPWPDTGEQGRPQRVAGAKVILFGGQLIGYLGRTGKSVLTFLPEEEPDRTRRIRALCESLASLARPGASVLLEKIDGGSPGDSVLATALQDAGFSPSSRGYLHKGRG